MERGVTLIPSLQHPNMTEVQTLIEAHAFDDLQADIDVLIAELEIGHSNHAVEGLLSLASNANSPSLP